MNVYEHIECLQCVASVVFAFAMHLYIFYLQCILVYVHGARLPSLIEQQQCTRVLSIVEMRGGDMTDEVLFFFLGKLLKGIPLGTSHHFKKGT